MSKINLLVVISALIGFIVFLFLSPGKDGSPVVSEFNAEAHANSPECWGLPEGNSGSAHIDTEKIYTKKELEKDADMAIKCREAKGRYIKSMRK
jgi:hypothetical protein